MAPFFSFASFGGGIASKLLGGATSSFSATGGTELEPGDGFKYHVFLSPGDFVVNAAGGEVTYLIVGGGGAGGSSGSVNPPAPAFAPGYPGYSGGGGAGGVLTGTSELSDTTTYGITVGSGAIPTYRSPGPLGSTSNGQRGLAGGSSTFNSLTALGGGGGGGYTAYGTKPSPAHSGGPGGSAGGAGAKRQINPVITGNSGLVPDPGQGNLGGDWLGPATWPSGRRGGGGGGAGGAGGTGGPPNDGSGGAALAVPAFPAPAILPAIPAPLQSSWDANVGPTGLYGRGGPGGAPSPSNDGIDYTGMGGKGRLGGNGYAGGDGIVIIKYPV